MNLNKLFNPRSVAVIGASDDKNKVGYTLMYNLLRGKKRKVYPINPTVKKVENILCRPSVKNIACEVDLAIIAVKPEIVPTVLKECGEKKIPFVLVPSREELGAAAGLQVSTSAVAILKEGDSKNLIKDLSK